MDQTHIRALEALQPFIHLANSTNTSSPRLIANLITNATSNPQTYIFAELLETPTIQSLRSPDTPEEFQGYLTLLEIFSWGTWQEYQSTPNLPPLNPEQTLKLRLLSLLTLSVTVKNITYDTLMNALSISNPSDLESLVTTAIYSSLLTARLSPASTPPTITVTSVAPLRDVKPQSLSRMVSVLTEWEGRCASVIGDIEAEITNIKTNAEMRRAKEKARNVVFEKTMHEINSESGGRRRGGGNKRDFSAADHDDADDDDGYSEGGADGFDGGMSGRMDIDEGPGSSRFGSGARHVKRALGRRT